MKKTIIIIIIILTIPIILISREWVIKQILPNVGDYDPGRETGPLILNIGNYYPKLMISTPVPDDWYRTVVFRFTGDSFEFETNIDTLHITGIGDFDNDGLIELLGFSVAYDSSIAVMEQQDTNQIYKIRTWDSKGANNEGAVFLGSTNLIKTDGIDRIYGADPPNCDSGWYYMSSDGDNSYYFDYILIEDREIQTMDIGYIDDDSLVDIIAGTSRGQTWWEAKNNNQDSFLIIRSEFPGGVGTHYTGILNDIDEDGLNEFIIGGLEYAMSPSWWEINIIEWKNDTIFEEIFQDTITKDYGPVPNTFNGSDYDIGDVDGDGKREIIVCAGSILRVYKVMGNDSFEKIWEMDNDTFSGSHVRVYDFNENGIDEIIWSGASDRDLPLTFGLTTRFAYIIENAPLSKLEYDNPVNMNNYSISTIERDSFYLYSTDELIVIIDSMRMIKGNEISLIEPLYPCSIIAGDSIAINIDIYSDIEGYITDTIIIYSNDWYGNVDSIEIRAGVGVQVEIDSAVARDGMNPEPGIDYDDFVQLYFNYPIEPIDTSVINLDTILRLSNGHSWYDGSGNIKYINHINGNTEIVIFLSTDTTLPTIAVGDTIYPDSVSIKDERKYSYVKKPIVLSGSFDPVGIEEEKIKEEQIYKIENNRIIVNSKEEIEIRIYDIIGREQEREKLNKGIIELNNYTNGIYFIRIKTKTREYKEKMVIIK